MQDVVEPSALPIAGGGGELDDRAWIHPRLHLPGETGHRIVRLVHDHQRAVEVEQVREGELDAAVFPWFETGCGLGDAGEVRFEVLVVGVDLAPLGVRDPKGLDGADHDAAMVAEIVRPDMGEVRDVEYPHPPGERCVQGLPVGVAGALERLDGLDADGVGRHQPQHQGILLLDPGASSYSDGMGCEDRLSAPGRKPQADVGDLR